MQVFVELPGGESITLDVEGKDTIEAVKAKIQGTTALPLQTHDLWLEESNDIFYNSEKLDDCRTISSVRFSGITRSTLCLKPKPSDGPRVVPAPKGVVPAPKGVALCVGVASYTAANDLPACTHDAEDMHALLKRHGFASTVLHNPANDELHAAVSAFVASVEAGDRAVFFFSGHGDQFQGDNFLLPCDFGACACCKNGPTDHVRHALALQRSVVQKLQAKSPYLSLILADACRVQSSGTKGDADSGLCAVTAPAGSVVGFGCAPGCVCLATDFHGGRNSLYTWALLKHLEEDDEIEHVLKHVAKTVVETIGEENVAERSRMRPWHHSDLIEDNVRLLPSSASRHAEGGGAAYMESGGGAAYMESSPQH